MTRRVPSRHVRKTEPPPELSKPVLTDANAPPVVPVPKPTSDIETQYKKDPTIPKPELVVPEPTSDIETPYQKYPSPFEPEVEMPKRKSHAAKKRKVAKDGFVKH